FGPSRTMMGLPVLARDEAANRFAGSRWHVALGDISARRRLLQSLELQGLPLASYISANTSTTPWTQIDSPAQIFRGSILSCDVRISHSVVINHGCILSHDVSVGAYTFIAPGV